MRPWAAAGLALVAAALGAAGALVVARETGVRGSTTTVVQAAAPVLPARVAPAAFDPAALYAARAPGVVTIYANLGVAGTSQGSGFVVGTKGLILTNAHVITNVGEEPGRVSGARGVVVEFSDGDRVAAKIVGWDLWNDIGVLRVEPADHLLRGVPLGDSSRVVVGQPVAAIGSPFGKQASLSVGVVSAVDRSLDSLEGGGFSVPGAIQTDASLNRGSSGGPLLDAAGRAIGLNAQIESATGTAAGVGFAIPINVARRSLGQLVATGQVRYAFIGVRTQDVTPGLARAFGLGVEHGALVTRVDPGTPAALAGLRGGSRAEAFHGIDVILGGDVIVAIGSRTIERSEDVSLAVAETLSPGQTVPFTVVRGGKRRTIDVTLGARPSGSG